MERYSGRGKKRRNSKDFRVPLQRRAQKIVDKISADLNVQEERAGNFKLSIRGCKIISFRDAFHSAAAREETNFQAENYASREIMLSCSQNYVHNFIFIVLAVLILSHELAGHFIVAKERSEWTNSAFGFPPKIAKFKKGETTYSLNLIPFRVRKNTRRKMGKEANDPTVSVPSRYGQGR